MTLVLQPLRPAITNGRFRWSGGLITGCYVAVQNLVWTLAHDFGTGALVLGVQIATLWRGGAQQKPEGQGEKTVVHVRVLPGQVP